jgi:hypothetical protein
MSQDLPVIRGSKHTCPICGYAGLDQAPYANLEEVPVPEGLEPPYGQHFGTPSFEVCDCCGFEFGNDDEPGTAEGVSFGAYRREWLDDGAQWFSPSNRPSGWSPQAQLSAAGLPLP